MCTQTVCVCIVVLLNYGVGLCSVVLYNTKTSNRFRNANVTFPWSVINSNQQITRTLSCFPPLDHLYGLCANRQAMYKSSSKAFTLTCHLSTTVTYFTAKLYLFRFPRPMKRIYTLMSHSADSIVCSNIHVVLNVASH